MYKQIKYQKWHSSAKDTGVTVLQEPAVITPGRCSIIGPTDDP